MTKLKLFLIILIALFCLSAQAEIIRGKVIKIADGDTLTLLTDSNKKIKIKNNLFLQNVQKKKIYDLIINCDSNNFLSNKFFTKKIDKNYNNLAYTTILKHKKIKNNVATQIFTKSGPIAFLPISNSETSIVFSLDTKNREYKDSEVLELIRVNNPKYQIKKIFKLSSFKLL